MCVRRKIAQHSRGRPTCVALFAGKGSQASQAVNGERRVPGRDVAAGAHRALHVSPLGCKLDGLVDALGGLAVARRLEHLAALLGGQQKLQAAHIPQVLRHGGAFFGDGPTVGTVFQVSVPCQVGCYNPVSFQELCPL